MIDAEQDRQTVDSDGVPQGKSGHLQRGDTAQTLASSFGDSCHIHASDEEELVYTGDEVEAMKQVRTKLLEEHGIDKAKVCDAFLAVATINCKLRIEDTVNKIVKLLGIMKELDCEDGIDADLWKPAAIHELKSFAPVGKCNNGCHAQWIRKGGKVTKEEQRNHVHACIMFYLANNRDARTLRNGMLFVFDLTGRDDMATEKRQGNEKLIQSFYQALPSRPQSINIVGCSFLLRSFINASIKVASLLIKQKMLARIHFSVMDDVKKLFPEKSLPKYCGGNGGGIFKDRHLFKNRHRLILQAAHHP